MYILVCSGPAHVWRPWKLLAHRQRHARSSGHGPPFTAERVTGGGPPFLRVTPARHSPAASRGNQPAPRRRSTETTSLACDSTTRERTEISRGNVTRLHRRQWAVGVGWVGRRGWRGTGSEHRPVAQPPPASRASVRTRCTAAALASRPPEHRRRRHEPRRHQPQCRTGSNTRRQRPPCRCPALGLRGRQGCHRANRSQSRASQ